MKAARGRVHLTVSSACATITSRFNAGMAQGHQSPAACFWSLHVFSVLLGMHRRLTAKRDTAGTGCHRRWHARGWPPASRLRRRFAQRLRTKHPSCEQQVAQDPDQRAARATQCTRNPAQGRSVTDRDTVHDRTSPAAMPFPRSRHELSKPPGCGRPLLLPNNLTVSAASGLSGTLHL